MFIGERVEVLYLYTKILVVVEATEMVVNVWLWSEGWTEPILFVYIKRLFLETGGYSEGSGHILILVWEVQRAS